MSAPRVRGILDEALRDGSTDSMESLLFVTGPSFQRVGMLAVEHDLTSLVMHCRPRGYDAGFSLRCQLDDFELGIQRVPRMHLLQESTRGARKRKKLVADVLRKEGGTRSSEGKNLQSMHHRSNMPVSARVLDIVMDRVVVSRNRLESGGMRVRQRSTWGAEHLADAQVLKPSRRHDGETIGIEVLGLLEPVGV